MFFPFCLEKRNISSIFANKQKKWIDYEQDEKKDALHVAPVTGVHRCVGRGV